MRDINKDRKFANKEAYEKVADRLGVPLELVEEVVNSQSLFTKKVINTGAFEGVIYPYFGKVKVNPRKVQKMCSKKGNK